MRVINKWCGPSTMQALPAKLFTPSFLLSITSPGQAKSGSETVSFCMLSLWQLVGTILMTHMRIVVTTVIHYPYEDSYTSSSRRLMHLALWVLLCLNLMILIILVQTVIHYPCEECYSFILTKTVIHYPYDSFFTRCHCDTFTGPSWLSTQDSYYFWY
jgi:hypothetical protein